MSGAAEGIAGLALSAASMASLFKTCIECYSLVVAARDFGQDYESLCTELSLQKLRFFLWGESVGLASRESKGQPRPNPGLGDPYIQPTVIRTLNAIKNLLSETQEFDERYGYKTEDASSGSVSRGLSIFRGTFDQFKIQTRRNQKQKSVATVTRWAIFDAEHFEVKITRLREFIDGLESITASLVALESQRDRLRQEIESISDVESLRLLRDVSDPDTDDVSDTASRRLTYIESSTHADAMSIISRMETSTTNQTFVTATSQRITGNGPQEENMESQNEWPLSNNISLPSSATESILPTRFRSDSRTRSFSILRRNKSGSSAMGVLKAYGKHDRDYSRQPAGPSRAAGKMVLYKLVVLGDGQVGKTALTTQLALQHFVTAYDPTIEDLYRKQVVIDGESCMLEVLDTAGQEEYTALRDQWIRDGEGFVLVYSISKRLSFTRISRFHHQIMRVRGAVGTRIPVMLVGHDYYEDEKGNFQRRDREVSIQEGQALGRDLGCDFVEASAKNCINVEKAFYDVVRALRTQRAPGMPIISE